MTPLTIANPQDVLYRAEARRYSYTIDADADRYGVTAPELKIYRYPVLRRTPKGAWIDVGSEPRFILLTANKRWACETEEEARESFAARRKRQIAILNAQLRQAHEDLRLVSERLDPISF